MTPDHPDSTPADDERGVLSDSTRTDTSALGFLGAATAQVNVALPATDEDDLADDDVIGDEVEPVGGEFDADDEEPDTQVEIVDAELEDDDEEGALAAVEPEPAERTFGADAAVEPAAEVEIVDAELEPSEGEAPQSEAPESEAPESEAPEGEGPEGEASDGEDPEGEAPDTLVDDAETEDAAPAASTLAASTLAASASAASASLRHADPTDSGREPAPVDTVAVDAAGAPVGAVAAAEEEAAVDETRAERAHAVERVRTRRPEVNLASKRLDQFEVDKESSDLLTPDRLLEHGRLARPEPEGAWQHFVYSVSGGRINLGDGKRARARKELSGRIAAPLPGGARFVPVLSRKGGVGKTTVTTLLGMALADARDDRVIAIDANPDRGTLAERISRHNGKTVRDLVRMKDSITGYNDVSTIVARDETRLDVLASDADPQVSVAFSDTDYENVATLAAHYYSIVLTDTGTGIVHSVMGATLGLADQLVIVAGLSVDEARLASETLTWLETNGYAAKARNAVVVLNNARPGAPLVREDELETHFRTRVRQVVRVPYDAAIATGSAIVFHDLQPETRQAARALAAAVVEGLRQLAAAA
ncbi:MinD/ParA family protein [Microbacterium protaetiae]|uniref:MinD/ParA family protein n=1 Tax=Microbacterium protaetiae TaxID=2509458 RepID=A0A4P6EMW9_9MICO|nr:AAA family ATPase [Microbacterium protaetiae]QAY61607.1 MinD/ParA family protein [Microbacterium protaetiae]